MWTLEVLLNAAQCEFYRVDPGSVAYIESYDVDAYRGVGVAKLTTDITKAIMWPSPGEALEAWRTRSNVRPTRDDGRPNRPLTAYSVSPIQVTANP